MYFTKKNSKDSLPRILFTEFAFEIVFLVVKSIHYFQNIFRFCPDFCDLVHVQGAIEQFAKQQKNAVLQRHPNRNGHTRIIQLIPGFLPGFHPDFAQIFAKNRPDSAPLCKKSVFFLIRKFRIRRILSSNEKKTQHQIVRRPQVS